MAIRRPTRIIPHLKGPKKVNLVGIGPGRTNITSGKRMRKQFAGGGVPVVITTTTTTTSTTTPAPLQFNFQTSGRYMKIRWDAIGTPTVRTQIEDYGEFVGEIVPAVDSALDMGSEALRSHYMTVDGDDYSVFREIVGALNDQQQRVYVGDLDFTIFGSNLNFISFSGEDYVYFYLTPNAGPNNLGAVDVSGLTGLEYFRMHNCGIDSLVGLDDSDILVEIWLMNSNLTTFPALSATAKANTIEALILTGNAIPASEFVGKLSGFGTSMDEFGFGGGGQPTSLPAITDLDSGLRRLVIYDTGITSISIDMSGFTSPQEWRFTHNASLTSLTMSNMNNGDFYFTDNNLPQANIDSLIQQIVALAKTSNEYSLRNNALMSSARYQDVLDHHDLSISAWLMVDMPAEDPSSGYTEVDPNSRITITSSSVAVAALDRSEAAYNYRDFGAGVIADNVLAWCKLNVASGTTGGRLFAMVLCNTLDDWAGILASDTSPIGVEIEMLSATTFQIVLHNASGTDIGNDTWRVGEDVYLYLVKRDGFGANGNVSLFYTDEPGGGRNKVGRQSAQWDTLNEVVGTRVNHRYLMLGCSEGGGGGGVITATISDFELLVE